MAASIWQQDACGGRDFAPSLLPALQISESQAQWLQLAALQYALQWLEAGGALADARLLPRGSRRHSTWWPIPHLTLLPLPLCVSHAVAKPPAAVPLPPGVRQPHHERMEELNSAATRGLQEWVREARGLPTNRQADLKFWEGEAELLARFKGLVGSAPKVCVDSEEMGLRRLAAVLL